MPSQYAPKPLPVYPWHQLVGPLLYQRYQVQGFSRGLWTCDWSLLRRTCGEKHPAEISVKEMEETLMQATRAGARATYVVRYKTIWRTLRHLGVVPQNHRPDEELPRIRKPRAVPRPITKTEAELLMTQASEPMRQWFTLACLAGLRAMEVAAIEGSWLTNTIEGYTLRVNGKGGTEMTIPAHPLVVAVIEQHRTLGRLYTVSASHLSERANKEMRRLGVNGTFHSCRHFFATYLLEVSNDIVLVAELMRHSNLNTTRGYAALRQGKKQEVLHQLFAPNNVVVA